MFFKLKSNRLFFIACMFLVFGMSLRFSYSHIYIAFAQAPAGETTDQKEARLRVELDKTEKEIATWRVILNGKKQESASLERDAAILNAKIQEAKLVIKARNIAIEQLGKDINGKEKVIGDLSAKIDRGRESLAQLVRKTNEIDSYSMTEMLLSNADLSEFFSDLDSFSTLKKSLEELFVEIRDTQAKTESERAKLDKKRDEETDVKQAVEAKKREVEKNEAEKQSLLKISKSQEKTYSQVLKDREARAAQIRSALFALRDSAAIPFGTALQYANEVQKATGIRAAFLLAIITQESDLGNNQGSCIISNIDTGDGVGKNTGTIFQQVMKAPRDTTPFKSITSRLGRDWKMTPVSCPPGATWTSGRGYGGGMGPSQFIPSTWELFKNRIGASLGIGGESADPWNPEHSFMATGIYMQDLGATGGSYTAERNAACKYYSGGACRAGRKPPNVFYGDQVMAKARDIQENMIDPLNNL